jgi:hypothetical protein
MSPPEELLNSPAAKGGDLTQLCWMDGIAHAGPMAGPPPATTARVDATSLLRLTP